MSEHPLAKTFSPAVMQNTPVSADAAALRVTALHTRFLYPFFFRPNSLSAATAALQQLRHRERNVWLPVPEPHELYRQELLTTVSDFLFRGDGGECHYLRTPEETVNSWFRSTTVVRYPDGTVVPVSLIPGVWIEVFLSAYGVGVLSISLQPDLRKLPDVDLAQSQAKLFNYRLAQRRANTAPTFLTPHPQDDPQRREKLQPGTPPPPADDAPFAERLGALGGRFTLSELADFLLAPLREQFHYAPVQHQFSVYTVARFGKDADLAREAVRAQLGPLLSGLAQVEEPTHAGAVEGTVDVPHQLLNARHWAAVGFLGAAHLVADQDPPHAFDEQRVPIVRDKYFIPYLVALLQRLILARADADAAATVRSLDRDQTEFVEKLHRLREELLNFAVSGDFRVVSSREAVNRFYALVRQGLRVPEVLSDIRRALADLDSARQAQQQVALARGLDHNIHTVASVQIKVEWLEVFFVSFYAAELSHLIAELFEFEHHYTAIATLAWAVGGGMLALFSLKPWQHGGERKSRLHRVVMTVVLVSVLVIGWFVFGLSTRPVVPHGWLP